MKLKKILAVALAATTALSSGVAYDMLGASAKVEAANSGNYYSAGDTFTVADSNFTYTYKVLKPIWNGYVGTSLPTGKEWANNALYDGGSVVEAYKFANNGNVKAADGTQVSTGTGLTVSPTTGGFVALTGISYTTAPSTEPATGDALRTITIPESISYSGSASSKVSFDGVDTNGTLNHSGVYYVTEVDLDGDNMTNAKYIDIIKFNHTNVGQIGSFKAQNFENLKQVVDNGDNDVAFTHAGTIDVSATNMAVSSGTLTKLYANDLKLETLDVSELKNKYEFNVDLTLAAYNGNVGVAVSGQSLKTVDVHGNENLQSLKLETQHDKGTTVNVSDCTGITELTAHNAVLQAAKAKKITSYDAPNLKGIKFITNGSDASYSVDLSFMNKARTVDLSASGIREFTAPSFDAGTNDGYVDGNSLNISDNSLTSVSLSSANNAGVVNVSNNKLLDCDVSGLNKSKSIDVSNNFLTSMDTTGLDDSSKTTVKLEGNYIPSANLSKNDKQTGVSLGTQNTADLFRWAYVGDIGQASGSESKAMMKLGGTGTLAAAMVVRGAPAGFAEKLAATCSWTEANTADSSAIALGESAVVQTMETAYNLASVGQGYLSGVVVSTGITANATKTSAEKVTLQYGNTKRDINISNDNIVLMNYDIASAIESENTKADNKYTLAYAQFLFPTEAFILNSAGTVDATLTSVKPLANVETTAETEAATGKFAKIVEQTLKKVEGMTFTKWNTAVDGTGTAVASGGKLKAVAEDTTVYANYTENTYSINYNSGKKANSVTVTGSTSTQNGIKYGEDTALTGNGFSTTKGNYYGWRGADGKFYSDGQSVHGIAAKKNKTESFTMQAFYGDADHYINTKESTISLTVGDASDGAYLLKDLGVTVTGDPDSSKTRDSQSGVDLGYDGGDIDAYYAADGKTVTENATFTAYSSNTDVVTIEVTGGSAYAVAKGSGTANIYVRDKAWGNLATVTVNVQSADEAAASAELKKAQTAANKSIEAGEKTDVSDFSKFAATIVKNADGENTVTVTKGKNVKTAKINTITIGDKTYTVTRIGANAYKGMSKLTTVTTSNQVKVIGKAAFANCKKLTKVTLGKKVAKIGANAFKGDKKLAKIMIKSKKLTTKAKVGKNSFKGIKATAKFYIAKKAATYKKVKKAIKAQSGAPKKAKYVKKYA